MPESFPIKELNDWLRHAAAINEVPRVKQLIEMGANPYDVDAEGRTAFNHAASNGLDALKYLTEIAFEDTQNTSGRRWPEYNLNTPSGKYGSTLITYACKVCDVGTIRRMFEAGADGSIVNGSGWNLLHATAVMPGRKEVLELLREKLGLSALNALTTQEYKTDYKGNRVTYSAGLTPCGLCKARIDQDKKCTLELKEYLPILSPKVRAIRLKPGDVGR